MALPTGQISMSQVNTELGFSSTAQIGLNDAAVRSLAGVASGQISMSNLQGKSSLFTFAIASNQINANLRTLAINAGWNQTSKVIATVNSNVYVYSTATATPGLAINGSWPGGIELVNNGFILGMGGNGGTVTSTAGQAGFPGGDAISLGVSCSITNNSYIAGGGGGGGGNSGGGHGGGGAGGGNGGGLTNGGGPGVAGGGTGVVTNNDATKSQGGGGGRILPGVGGALSSGGCPPNIGCGGGVTGRGGGAGGGGGGAWGGPPGPSKSVTTGVGGSSNNAGGNGSALGAAGSGGGGGGWGAAGGRSSTTFVGGAGGKAVALNGFSLTWVATGTRYGAIS